MIRSLIVIVLMTVLFDNCSTDMKKCTQQVPAADLAAVDQTQLTKDVAFIDTYLAGLGITPMKDGALRYVISSPGTGNAPCLESNISVTYSGKLMSKGTVFDASTTPTTFQLSGLILGWKVGLLNVSKGAVITLYIPSGYAYGAIARTGIPANSNLVFDLVLVDFTN